MPNRKRTEGRESKKNARLFESIASDLFDVADGDVLDWISDVDFHPQFKFGTQLNPKQIAGLKRLIWDLVGVRATEGLSWCAISSKHLEIGFSHYYFYLLKNGAFELLDRDQAVIISAKKTETGWLGQIPELTLVIQVKGLEYVYKSEYGGKNGKVVRDSVFKKLSPSGRLTALVFGNTGAGKSTLIRGLGCSPEPVIGTGKAVPHDVMWHENRDKNLAVIDIAGWELGQGNSSDIAKKILGLAKAYKVPGNSTQGIDVIWYCVNSRAGKIMAEEIRFMADIQAKTGIPTICVVTRAPERLDKRDSLLAVLLEKKRATQVHDIVVLNAEEERMGLEFTPVHGLDRLISASKRAAKS